MSPLTLVKEHNCHGGFVRYYSHESSSTGTTMRFAAFIPPQAADEIEEPTSTESIDVGDKVLMVVGSRSESRAGRTIDCPAAPAVCSSGNGSGLQKGATLAGYDKAADPALAPGRTAHLRLRLRRDVRARTCAGLAASGRARARLGSGPDRGGRRGLGGLRRLQAPT